MYRKSEIGGKESELVPVRVKCNLFLILNTSTFVRLLQYLKTMQQLSTQEEEEITSRLVFTHETLILGFRYKLCLRRPDFDSLDDPYGWISDKVPECYLI